MKKFWSRLPSPCWLLAAMLSPRGSLGRLTRAPRKSFWSATADSSTSLPIPKTVSMASISSLNLRRAISVRSRCIRSCSDMILRCSLSLLSSALLLASSLSTSCLALCSSLLALCSLASCASSRPLSSSCLFRSSSTYSLRSLSFSFILASSSVMSPSLVCTGISLPTASLRTCSARRHASVSACVSLWWEFLMSSISFSLLADAPLSSWSTLLTLSTSSAISFSSASACLSCCRRSISSPSYLLEASSLARYSGLPLISSTSNLAITVPPTASASASVLSTALAKVRTTNPPSCPSRRLRRTLTGSPMTSLPSTPQITSPTLTRPSLSADPPLTIVLTYTLPSGSCWKKIPTPLMWGPPCMERDIIESLERTDEYRSCPLVDILSRFSVSQPSLWALGLGCLVSRFLGRACVFAPRSPKG
mmetsp:Transcript_26536/g.61485  ORF Transcript_26536/g.61485 Transcript_26536/m.61485 type:complete len:421 (+) Transcript_26536:1128-2390(+)